MRRRGSPGKPWALSAARVDGILVDPRCVAIPGITLRSAGSPGHRGYFFDQELVREVLSFCPGRARPILETHLGVVELAGHDYRTALLADALTRDGEHAMAEAQANELPFEVAPGRLTFAVVGRLARTALHARSDGPARLAALAATTLARLG